MTRFLAIFSSIRLTVVLLGATVILIFLGTLDQIEWGIYHAQKVYFHSFFVWVPVCSNLRLLLGEVAAQPADPIYFPFPGGVLLGLLLSVNLTLNQFISRSRTRSRGKAGILLLHAGVLILIVSFFLTGVLQKEFVLRLRENNAGLNYVEDISKAAFVLTDESDTREPRASAPVPLMRDQQWLDVPATSLRVFIHCIFQNAAIASVPSHLALGRENELNRPVALDMHGNIKVSREKMNLQGICSDPDMVVVERPTVRAADETNTPAAVVEIFEDQVSLGVWVVSSLPIPALDQQMVTTRQGRLRLGFHYEQTRLPFFLSLDKFIHTTYPGTDIPKDFSSHVRISSPGLRDTRTAVISMNHPLRYGGYSFYQSSFTQDGETSILHVTRNPAGLFPYLGILATVVGMIVHFCSSLSNFLRKNSAEREPSAFSRNGPFSGWLYVGVSSVFFSFFLTLPGLSPRNGNGFNWNLFGELPVQSGGRVLPVGSVARNELKLLSGKSAVRHAGESISAINWFAMVVFDPDRADQLKVFRIDHPNVLGMLGFPLKEKYFSWRELKPELSLLEGSVKGMSDSDENRTTEEKAIVRLLGLANRYSVLRYTFIPADDSEDFDLEIAQWKEVANEAVSDGGAPAGPDPRFAQLAERFLKLAKVIKTGVLPANDSRTPGGWQNAAEALICAPNIGSVPPILQKYGDLGKAYRAGNADGFNSALQLLHAALRDSSHTWRVQLESYFNRTSCFYFAAMLYSVAFLFIAFSWLGWKENWMKLVICVLCTAWLLHTFGLICRVCIQGRPPVTNLYSSAVFAGWIAVTMGMAMERQYRNALGATVASLIGFGTLIIAHNLSNTGDTMELMKAVLDSNFWLSTHVVAITAGYGAMFLAGFIAALYILRSFLRCGSDQTIEKSLIRMAYGVTCFGLLFSFVGTMLGGIWADQSWGRFWGWDPKENGALMIVLWAALALHARISGIGGARGFMSLVVLGNVVTAWSWFGTNMLGIGLHAYTSLNKAFSGLALFCLSQIVLACLAHCHGLFRGASPSCERTAG